MRNYADDKYLQAVTRGKADTEDLKIYLTPNELKILIGEKSVNELEALFENSYDEIIIRRCQAHGKFIKFHSDVSIKTL